MGVRAASIAWAPILAAALAACAPPRDPGPPPPNVLLITLDTLRADHLSAYGYDRPTSPFLDSLAARGTLFTSAYAASNITKPSHASILTALYPKHHGITTNTDEVLHDDIVTAAEIFRDRGYATFAVVATNLLDGRRSGLDQGFDVYDDLGDLEQRGAQEVTEIALVELRPWRQAGDGPPAGRPFFAWLHYYDPHIPYKPPSEFGERFWRPPASEAGRVRLPVEPADATEPVNGAIPSSSVLGPNRDPELYEAAYDGEIAYLDDELRRLFTTLDDWGVAENTIVAVTADHGEMLGEYGIYYNHASLYEPVAAVPLILVVPGASGPSTVDAVVENLDLVPTFFDLLGWPSPPVDGESLVPLLEGGEHAGDLAGYAFTQHSYGLLLSARDAQGALIATVPSRLETIVTPHRRFDREAFLRYVRAETLAYYPRAAVASETAPLDPDRAPRSRGLVTALRKWREHRRPYPEPRRHRLTAEEIEQLESLGYL